MSIANQDLLILIAIFGVVALGLDLLIGYTRIPSVTQALLFGVGAFSYAGITERFETPSFLLAVLVAVPIAMLISAITGFVSLRVVGDSFIVVSFATQLIGVQVIYNWSKVSGGPNGKYGLPFPSVFGWVPTTTTDFLVLTGSVCLLCYLVVTGLVLSPYGRLIRALGQEESALAAAGFSGLKLKVSTFMLCGALAAVGGVLYASYQGIAQVGDFSINLSMMLLAMVIIGGGGRIVGGLIGAALLQTLTFKLNQSGIPSSVSGPLNQAIFGGLVVAIVLFMPGGITGGAESLWRRGKGWISGRRASSRPVESATQLRKVEQ